MEKEPGRCESATGHHNPQGGGVASSMLESRYAESPCSSYPLSRRQSDSQTLLFEFLNSLGRQEF